MELSANVSAKASAPSVNMAGSGNSSAAGAFAMGGAGMGSTPSSGQSPNQSNGGTKGNSAGFGSIIQAVMESAQTGQSNAAQPAPTLNGVFVQQVVSALQSANTKASAALPTGDADKDSTEPDVNSDNLYTVMQSLLTLLQKIQALNPTGQAQTGSTAQAMVEGVGQQVANSSAQGTTQSPVLQEMEQELQALGKQLDSLLGSANSAATALPDSLVAQLSEPLNANDLEQGVVQLMQKIQGVLSGDSLATTSQNSSDATASITSSDANPVAPAQTPSTGTTATPTTAVSNTIADSTQATAQTIAQSTESSTASNSLSSTPVTLVSASVKAVDLSALEQDSTPVSNATPNSVQGTAQASSANPTLVDATPNPLLTAEIVVPANPLLQPKAKVGTVVPNVAEKQAQQPDALSVAPGTLTVKPVPKVVATATTQTSDAKATPTTTEAKTANSAQTATDNSDDTDVSAQVNTTIDTKGVDASQIKASADVVLPVGGDSNTQNGDAVALAKAAQNPVETAQSNYLDRMQEHVALRQVSQRIQWMVNNQEGHTILRLDPPELGHIELDVQTKDGEMKVHMTVDNNEVKQALESSVGDLRNAMVNHNIKLDRLEVQVASSGQNDANANRREGSPSGKRQSSQGIRGTRFAEASTVAPTADTGRRLGYNTMELLA